MFAWIIVLVCWAHQINLIVGDFLWLKLPFLKSIPLALDCKGNLTTLRRTLHLDLAKGNPK
jgi:hypothetical protein